MSKGYEERYLITLLSAVMNQKAPPEPMRQLSWEKMFRLADYHHIAHVVYYGIMGLPGNIPQNVRQRFFDKYLEAVYRPERLREGEKQVRALMEIKGINCFILNYHDIVRCYPIEEMCCCESIEIGAAKKQERSIRETLQSVDFEERQTEERGHLYYRIPGIRVLYYDQSMFFSKLMRKYYRNLLKALPNRKGFRYVREMSADDKYLFLMCRLTDCYARGDISLNQIVDFWVFYKKNAQSFSWPYIYEKLEKFKIAEFAERLEYLTLRWFGPGAGIENVEVYDAMESYILTKGTEGREVSSQFLPLVKTVADCYDRDRKAENLRKIIRWLFPDEEYMETIYPVLETKEFLLPAFWVMRLGRYGVRYIYKGIEENVVQKAVKAWKKAVRKVTGAQQKAVGKFLVKRIRNWKAFQEEESVREELRKELFNEEAPEEEIYKEESQKERFQGEESHKEELHKEELQKENSSEEERAEIPK